MQSDPEDEYEEILLKAEAPMRAIRLCVSGQSTSRGGAGVPGVARVRG